MSTAATPTAEQLNDLTQSAARLNPPSWRPSEVRSGITFTNIFCGFGGSSVGLENAGLQFKLAAEPLDPGRSAQRQLPRRRAPDRRRVQLRRWQLMQPQADAQLTNVAAYPHGRLRREALDTVAEHLRRAEKLPRALDDVLDPTQSDAGRDLSTRHLQHRVERERHALAEAS